MSLISLLSEFSRCSVSKSAPYIHRVTGWKCGLLTLYHSHLNIIRFPGLCSSVMGSLAMFRSASCILWPLRYPTHFCHVVASSMLHRSFVYTDKSVTPSDTTYVYFISIVLLATIPAYKDHHQANTGCPKKIVPFSKILLFGGRHLEHFVLTETAGISIKTRSI